METTGSSFALSEAYVAPFGSLLERVEARRLTAADGTPIAYEVVPGGTEGTIILANGLGGRLYAWLPLIEALGARFTFITWDYRGLFESGMPSRPGHMGVDDHARDLVAILDAEGLAKAHVVGWSMGVQVALEAATRHPERVQSLVLINGTYGQVFSTAFQPLVHIPIPHTLLHGAVEAGVRWPWIVRLSLASSLAGTRALVRTRRLLGAKKPSLMALGLKQYLRDLLKTSVENYLLLFQELDAHSVYHLLPQIQQPTLVVSGGLDYLTPAYQSKHMARRIPGAKHLRLPLATHFVLLERPEPVVRAITEHLGRA